MVDAAFVYVVGVLVFFFFWIYGVVAFLRDVKNWLIPAYRQWRGEDTESRPDIEEPPGEAATNVPPQSRNVDE